MYCCGTSRPDRSGFPREITVKSMRGRKRGDNMWRMKSSIVAQVWVDSKPVHLLTTIHAPEYDASVPAADRTVKRKGKRGERDGIDVPSPPCISDYNSFMGGIDFADRIVKYYNYARRSRRWNRRVIFHLLELSIHNAYVIDSFFNDHRSATNVLMLKHQSFREELADQLVGGFRNGRKRVGRPSDMYATEARLQNVGLHHPSSDVSKDCALCTRKAKALQPGGVIPRGVSRHALGIRRSNIRCVQCSVHLCQKLH